MGRQVRFRLTDDEVRLLDAYVRDAGGVVVAERSDNAAVEPLDHLPLGGPNNWTAQIVRSADLPNVRRRLVSPYLAEPPMPDFWSFDSDSVPSVEYVRHMGGPSGHGRLWHETTNLVGNELVPVDASFIVWATGLFRWVKTNFTYDRAEELYVGPPRGVPSRDIRQR